MTFETPDDVLEHFGVKGMRRGARKVGAGARRTGRFTKRHPKVVGAIIAGAALSARLMSSSVGSSSISSPPNMPFRAAGRDWMIEAQDGRTFDVLVRSLTERR